MSLINNNAGNVYYNARITNTKTSTNLLKMEYEEEMTTPIINKPNDYVLSIVRFNIPSNALPLFNYGNLQTVTLSYSGNDYQENVVYIPIASSVFDPSFPQPVYYYSQMVQMINNALTAAFTALKTANPGAPPTEAPYLIFNPTTQLFSFITQTAYDPVINPVTIEIFFNSICAKMFETIEMYSFGRNLPFGKDVQLTIRNTNNNYYPNPTTNTGYYQFTSQFPYFREWNQLNSIVIVSKSLPTRREMTGSVTNASESEGISKYVNILTDFTPQINNNSEVLSTFYYYPQGPYRFIDLMETNPLVKFDFAIYWTDFAGNFYPLYLAPGNEVNIKFLFMNKKQLGYYQNNV